MNRSIIARATDRYRPRGTEELAAALEEILSLDADIAAAMRRWGVNPWSAARQLRGNSKTRHLAKLVEREARKQGYGS